MNRRLFIRALGAIGTVPILAHHKSWHDKGPKPEPEPTEEPTAEPTEEPTAEPTEEPTAEPTGELVVDGDQVRLDGEVVKLDGMRAAAATQNQTNTDNLIAELDEYKAHGLNAIAVFLAGARYNHSTPWDSSGNINAADMDRMEQIAEAMRVRDMVLVAGLFYQHAVLGLDDEAAVINAVRQFTTNLMPWRNVIVNPANEQNSPGWDDTADIFDFRKPAKIIQLLAEIHDVDADRLCGGGGYDDANNKAIALDPESDLALWDTGDYDAEGTNTDTRYDWMVSQGVTKPQVNVEIFGGWTRLRLSSTAGEYTQSEKDQYLAQAEASETRPGLGVFWHDNRWTQPDGVPPRFDLAHVDGTATNPGWRWYAEAVRDGV